MPLLAGSARALSRVVAQRCPTILESRPWSTSTGKKCWLYRGTTYAAMGRLEEALADLSLFAEARRDYPGIEETIGQIKIQLPEP